MSAPKASEVSERADSLSQILTRRILEDRPIGIDDYMRAALTHRDKGYYATRDPLWRGEDGGGDFLTAPEASQVFGEMIGLWFVSLWQEMNAPSSFLFVELGGGRGTLTRDALRAAAQTAPRFVDAARIVFVETSPVLRERQARAVPEARFHDSFYDVPFGEKPLFIVANEFFDALPVQQFLRREDGFYERLVGLKDDGFAPLISDKRSPAPAPFALKAPLGEIIEIRPEGERLAEEIGRRIASEGGAALIMDYGHARSSYGDTLQSVRRHRTHPVFAAPGEADISAHVDFERLRLAAERGGAHVTEVRTQGAFLRSLGAGERFQRLMADASAQEKRALARQARRLMAPEEMGRLFKTMAIIPPSAPMPAGFA